MIELQALGPVGAGKEQALLPAPDFLAPLAEPISHVSDWQDRRVALLEQEFFKRLSQKRGPRISVQLRAVAPDLLCLHRSRIAGFQSAQKPLCLTSTPER